MCYTVYASTESSADFAKQNCELVRFDKLLVTESDPCVVLLEFPNKWFIESKSGCSCDFRFLHPASIDLGFSEPVAWYPEEPDAVEATRRLYRRLRDILTAGYRFDLLSIWEGTRPEEIKTLDVFPEDIPEKDFRMFEGYKFRCRSRAYNRESHYSERK